MFKLLRVEGISSVAPFVIARMGLDQRIAPDFLFVRSIILSF